MSSLQLDAKKNFDYVIGGLGLLILKPVVLLLGKFLKRDHSLKPKGNVLILKLLGGGSLIQAYPALLPLKQSLLPKQKFILLTTPAIVPFAIALQVFDEVQVLQDDSILSMISSLSKFTFKNFGRVDTCIDLEVHSRGTAILSLLIGARNRLGFYKDSIYWRIGLYTHLVFYNTYSLSSAFYENLIGLTGIKPLSLQEAITSFKNLYPAKQNFERLALGFSCSGHAMERKMSPQQWVMALTKANVSQSIKQLIHVLGSKAEIDAAEILVKDLKGAGFDAKNECGNFSLHETIQFIAESSSYWGIDSGLLHLARLLGKDTTSFWGPTDPMTRLKLHPGAKDVIHYHKLDCSPCVHFANNPPCQGNNLCMEAIFSPQIAEQKITWPILASPEDAR